MYFDSSYDASSPQDQAHTVVTEGSMDDSHAGIVVPMFNRTVGSRV